MEFSHAGKPSVGQWSEGAPCTRPRADLGGSFPRDGFLTGPPAATWAASRTTTTSTKRRRGAPRCSPPSGTPRHMPAPGPRAPSPPPPGLTAVLPRGLLFADTGMGPLSGFLGPRLCPPTQKPTPKSEATVSGPTPTASKHPAVLKRSLRIFRVPPGIFIGLFMPIDRDREAFATQRRMQSQRTAVLVAGPMTPERSQSRVRGGGGCQQTAVSAEGGGRPPAAPELCWADQRRGRGRGEVLGHGGPGAQAPTCCLSARVGFNPRSVDEMPEVHGGHKSVGWSSVCLCVWVFGWGGDLVMRFCGVLSS